MAKKQRPIHPKTPSGPPAQREDRIPKRDSPETSRASAWRNLFGVDPRSLALFRVAIALLLLVDLAIRASDLQVMYTDDGMFSRAEICRRATTIWNWSFHFGGGSWGFQAMLFGLAAVLGLALLVGFETRLATIGSWLMLVSIHHRVPPILSGAEILLRMLLFWGMFLPWERVVSLDHWLGRRRGAAVAERLAPVLSVASVAALVQMGLMYLFSAIYKSNAQWWHGEAIAGSLVHDFYASPAAGFLLSFPRLLTVLTWGTFALEWAAPLLLFFPRRTATLRLGTIAALALMHVGITIFLEIGLFSYVALAGLALFLPAEFWESRLFRRFRKPSGVGPAPAGARVSMATRRAPYSFAAQCVCGVAFIYVIAVNLNGLPSRPLRPLAPEKWKPVATTFGLGQRWGMFDTVPSKDGWYVARALLQDGSEVDLLRQGAPVNWQRPQYPSRVYPNYFWQKLFREMAYDDAQGFQLLRAPVAEFLCRRWNAGKTEGKQVAEFDFVFCTENQSRDGSTPGRFREQLLHLDLSGL